ncbi:hypothetical protein OG607_28280 [Streptomyces sp. NBC_01537]|uniref:hypothetical protein n=1 Tax=Streptomyces sp. NBC_01537 TaxID=2903896 RepID=UPI00386778C3
MDMTLRRISAADADTGFRHVVSGFSGERSGVESECFLGREWEFLEQILLTQGPEEISELPITMGDLLGDDDLGTACFYLPPDEVAVAARFLVAVDAERSVADHADEIARAPHRSRSGRRRHRQTRPELRPPPPRPCPMSLQASEAIHSQL